MRELLILNGVQGSGKSTFIKNNNLKEHCLSLDSLRETFLGYIYDKEGRKTLPKATPKKIITMFKEALEARMAKGEFLVIDNMNLDPRDYKHFSEVAKIYGYTTYIKRFEVTDSQQKLYLHNRGVDIPDDISLSRSRAKYNSITIPSSFSPIESINELRTFQPPKLHDLKNYDVYVIGDIHGCMTELKKFLDKNYNEDSFYIFVGDYIDRGYDNSGVVNLLYELQRENSNIILLEGNHERWLRYWANGSKEKISSKEFTDYTLPEFEREINSVSSLRKSRARKFCDILQLYSYIDTVHGKVYITHGGSNLISEDSKMLMGDFYIKGQGKYADLPDMYDQGSKDADIVIHGHRNLSGYGEVTLHAGKSFGGITKYFNVEGSVELGGHLKYVKIPKDPNEKPTLNKIKSGFNGRDNVSRLLVNLRESPKDILERPCSNPDVKSFNFSKDVFYKKRWTSLNCTARGLFIDVSKEVIVGRGYSKYFNLGENSKSELSNLAFPVKARLKENGYLGLLYVNNGKFVFNSKAGDLTDFAERFEKIFKDKVSEKDSDKLKNFLETNNLTATFEVMIPDRDNLVYFDNEEDLAFLDFIHNMVTFRKAEPSLRSKGLGCFSSDSKVDRFNPVIKVLYSETELKDFLFSSSAMLEEGFVLEDSSGLMVKWKAPIYQVCKALRAYKSTGNRSNVYPSLVKYDIIDHPNPSLNITKKVLGSILDKLDLTEGFPKDLTSIQSLLINTSK